MAEGQIIFPSDSMKNETFILFVNIDNKIQSLPRLTLLSSADECSSVTRDALILGVFIALVAEIFFVDVGGSTPSSVVWEAENDEEMAECAHIKRWLDEPAKSWSEQFRNMQYFNYNYADVLTSPDYFTIVIRPITKGDAE